MAPLHKDSKNLTYRRFKWRPEAVLEAEHGFSSIGQTKHN
jgi:hypothetical protein